MMETRHACHEYFLGSSWIDVSKFVKLGSNAWGVAKEVFHLSSYWAIKDCNTFMGKYLQMVPKQRKEFEACL